MDDFAVGYLINRFFYRIADFFKHWYVDGTRAIAHRLLSTLEEIDQTLAVAVTCRYFFQPLYKDYSVIGRILGIIFRTGRIVIGGAIYLVIVIFFFAVYLAWIAVPASVIFFAARNL